VISYGVMVLWCYAAVVQWYSGAMGLWGSFTSALVVWFCDTMVL
jgi:hypothetical protein